MMNEAYDEIDLDRSRYLLLKQAVDALASVCDRAQAKDGRGYNGSDTTLGHLLAFLDLSAWPPSTFHRVWQMLRKYRQQLADMGIAYDSLPEPPYQEGNDRSISLHVSNDFLVVFPYQQEIVAAFWRIPGGELRTTPIRHQLVHAVPGAGEALLLFAERYQFWLAPGVREQAALIDTGCRACLERDGIALYCPRDDARNAEIKRIPGWRPSYRPAFHWIIPVHPTSLKALRAFLAHHPEFTLSPEVEQRLREADRPLAIRDLLP